MPAEITSLACSVEQSISWFIDQKKAEGCAPSTLSLYRYALQLFAEAELPDVSQLKPVHIILFTERLRAKKLKPGAIHAYQRAVWTWLRWLYRVAELIEADLSLKVQKIRVTDPKRRTATDDARTKMLKVARDRSEHRYRNVAVIELLWSAGVRRGEIQHFTLDQTDLEAGTITVPGIKDGVRVTKSGKPHTIAIGVQARLALREYLVKERGMEPGPLFLMRRKRALSNRAVQWLVDSLAKDAGVEVSSHDFRRAAAARMLREGVPVEDVARQLGQSTLTMALQYGEQGRTERALRSFHMADRVGR